jgi:hypothetical protein
MSDDAVFSALARMREPMLKAHPEWLSGCVSCTEECALCLEKYQAELLAKLTRYRDMCERLAKALLKAEIFCTWLCEDSKKYPGTDAGNAAKRERHDMQLASDAYEQFKKEVGE